MWRIVYLDRERYTTHLYEGTTKPEIIGYPDGTTDGSFYFQVGENEYVLPLRSLNHMVIEQYEEDEDGVR